MMRIAASYHGHSSNAATVYFTPPWWAFWRRTTERVALLTHLPIGGKRWRWLDGSDVPGAVWCVLTDAYRAHLAHLAYHAAVGLTATRHSKF